MVLINAGNRASSGPRRSTSRHHRHSFYSSSSSSRRSVKWSLVACASGTVAALVYTIVWIARTHHRGGGPIIRRSNQAEQFNRQHHHQSDQDHPELHLEDREHGENADLFDTIASDIIITLECHKLLNDKEAVYVSSFGTSIYGGLTMWSPETMEQQKQQLGQRNRRLDDANPQDDDKSPDANEGHERMERDTDDDMFESNQGRFSSSAHITAAHLFCMAALPTNTGIPDDMDETFWWSDKVQCAVRTSIETQRHILDLWGSAKAEISNTKAFKKLLQVATEKPIDMFGKHLNVWAAPNDSGTEYFVNSFQAVHDKQVRKQPSLDEDNEYDYLIELHENLGEGKLFVDVGSGLGYTAMAIAILYPGTEIISIEAAYTNWLLQELNWRCNDFEGMEVLGLPTVLLDGIGPSTSTSLAARFVWRPSETTNTRAWALNAEKTEGEAVETSRYDMELNVKLRPWHMVQAEADIVDRDINILNIDCEGCEYNLVPALKEAEFSAISTVLGQLHWGYIPALQLPSSKRAEDTHKRLCQHEDFARTAIECCAFPDLEVKSRSSGEILVLENNREAFPEVPATVKDLAGGLCDRFEAWAEEHSIFNVESDWGWFQGGTARQRP